MWKRRKMARRRISWMVWNRRTNMVKVRRRKMARMARTRMRRTRMTRTRTRMRRMARVRLSCYGDTELHGEFVTKWRLHNLATTLERTL